MSKEKRPNNGGRVREEGNGSVLFSAWWHTLKLLGRPDAEGQDLSETD